MGRTGTVVVLAGLAVSMGVIIASCVGPKERLWPVLLAGVGLMLATVFGALIAAFGGVYRKRNRAAAVLRDGTPADAVVLEAERTGDVLREGLDFPKYSTVATVEVRPVGGTPFRARVELFIYEHEWTRLGPGMAVRCRFDPRDRSRVALVGFGGVDGGEAPGAASGTMPGTAAPMSAGIPGMPGQEALAALLRAAAAGGNPQVIVHGDAPPPDVLGSVEGLATRMRLFLETRDPARAAAIDASRPVGERIRALVAAIDAWNDDVRRVATTSAPARVLRCAELARLSGGQKALVELGVSIRPERAPEYEQTLMAGMAQDAAARCSPGQWISVAVDPADPRRIVVAP